MRTTGTDKPNLWHLGEIVSGDLGPYTMHRTRGRKLVAYPRSPPNKPPSPGQRLMRNAWRWAAYLWQQLTPEVKANWKLAGERCSLRIRGFELWMHWQTTGNAETVRTVEQKSGITLLTPDLSIAPTCWPRPYSSIGDGFVDQHDCPPGWVWNDMLGGCVPG